VYDDAHPIEQVKRWRRPRGYNADHEFFVYRQSI
jgi:hypothetical protein